MKFSLRFSISTLCVLVASSFATSAHADTFYVANSATASIEKFSAAGTDLGAFATTSSAAPTAIVFDRAGDLYATFDNSSSTIEEFSSTGVTGIIATTGLDRPYGLALDSAGNLYAANYSSDTVEKFSAAGVDLGVFASTNLNGPVGLAFDTAGNLYVSNVGSSSIEKFSATGSDLGVFASAGLREPYGLAFDAAGNLYAANYGGGTVEKLSSAGADLGAFATTGLDSPIDLAFDGAGNLYVVNEFSATIREISAAGVDLGVFATAPAGSSPSSIAIQITNAATGALQFGAAFYDVDENAGSVSLNVRRPDGSAGAVSVSYATSDGTALANVDYAATSGTLTWEDGDDTAQQITVTILDRFLDDGSTLYFNVELSNPAGGATLGVPSFATVNILESDTAPQPTVSIASPPDGLTVFAGASIPFAASVNDPGGLTSLVQFFINGADVYDAQDSGPFLTTLTAPSMPGAYTLMASVTDTQGRTSQSNVVTVNVKLPTAETAVAPTTDLLTPFDGLTLPVNTTVTLSVGALAAPTATLQQVSLYANGALIASFNGQGNLISAHGSEAGRPVRRDATSTGAANLFQTNYTLPGISQIMNIIAVAVDSLGQSTISTVASAAVVATTDPAPLVALSGLDNDASVALGSVNSITVTASDPGITSSVAASGRPIRRDASGNSILKQVEYFVNGLSLGASTAPPYSFNFAPTTPGKYVLEAVATDGSNLSALSAPLEVEVGAPTVDLSVAGAGQAVAGGARAKVLVTRTGDTSQPLTVFYKVKGAAVAGVDYQALPGTIVIPAGADRAVIKVKAIEGAPGSGLLKVKIKLLGPPDGVSYDSGVASAKVFVLEP